MSVTRAGAGAGRDGETREPSCRGAASTWSCSTRASTPRPRWAGCFQILGSIAEIEYALMSERTLDGLAAAAQAPSSPRQVKIARDMYEKTGPDGRRVHTVAPDRRRVRRHPADHQPGHLPGAQHPVSVELDQQIERRTRPVLSLATKDRS